MEAREILARCPLFSAIDTPALDRLAPRCRQVALSSGDVLFQPGDPADALYIVVTGRLRALLGTAKIPTEIGRLEPVGEIGLFSEGIQSARVQAVRDSSLLRIDREELLDFVQSHPSAMLAITRETIARLRTANIQRQRRSRLQHRAFAVVPAHPGIDIVDFAQRLRHAMDALAPVCAVDAAHVDAALGEGASEIEAGPGPENDKVVAWLDELEARHAEGYLVYTASHQADPWSRRCMRQADRILVVAEAGDLAMLTPMVDDALRYRGATPIDLVLLRSEDGPAGDIAAWKLRLDSPSHYFVRPRVPPDHAALARQLCGRGIGLVLGGGGARGFAHIGLLRALEALDIPVDIAGGSSMGAFLAAARACGWDHRQTREMTRQTFVDRNYLNDYMLPRVALIRGRKLLDHLREVFDDRRIETLRTPFFCITTNLTRGATSTHDMGELALWVGVSMAIPGIAPPLVWHGELHVDGAVVNSLPTDVMQTYGRGPIIASDVSTEGTLTAPGIEGPDPEALFRRSDLKGRISLFDILFSTATLTSESGVKARAARADCYLRMPLDGVGMFDWKRMDEIADNSYAFAMRKLEPMREILMGRAEPPEPEPEDPTPP